MSGGKPSSRAGCARYPTRWCGSGRCSASRSSVRWHGYGISTLSTSGWRTSTLCPLAGRQLAQPPPGLVVVDGGGYQSLPASIEMYRAAVALSRSDLDGTMVHAREALSLTPPDDDVTRAAAGALAGLASWTTGDLAGAHAAYTQTVGRAGKRRADRRCPRPPASPSVTFAAPRGNSVTPCATTSGPWTLEALSRGACPCRERLTCTSRWRRYCSTPTTSRLSRYTWPSASISASTTGWRRTHTGGGSLRPGCGSRGDLDVAPRAARRSSPRLCRRLLHTSSGWFPRCGHGYGSGAASWITPARGRANGSCARARASYRGRRADQLLHGLWPRTTQNATTPRSTRRSASSAAAPAAVEGERGQRHRGPGPRQALAHRALRQMRRQPSAH